MKNFTAYLFGALLLIGLLEILAFIVLIGIEINDFNNEVKSHNRHFYTTQALVNEINKPISFASPVSMADTLIVNSKLHFAFSISDHCCAACVSRDNNPWIIRVIWPLFDIKK